MGNLKDDSLCLMPCHLQKTQILLESKSVDEKAGNCEDGQNQTFILKLPSTVISTESSFSYSFLSFLAEFGSWLGLFTGLSVVQVHIQISLVRTSFTIFQVPQILTYLRSWSANKWMKMRIKNNEKQAQFIYNFC